MMAEPCGALVREFNIDKDIYIAVVLLAMISKPSVANHKNW